MPASRLHSSPRTDVHHRAFVRARVIRVRQHCAPCSLKTYNGSLVSLPVVGIPLVLLTIDGRRLVTSEITQIVERDRSMNVKTMNSEYRVEFVLPTGARS